LRAGSREIEWDRGVELRTVDERDQAVRREFTEVLKRQSEVGVEETR